MLRYIVSLCLLAGVVGTGYSQIDSADLRPPRPPREKKEAREFIPTGVRLGVDLYAIGRSVWEKDEMSLLEFQADVDFRHFLLSVDYGTSETSRFGENFDYSNEGSYFRIGPDVNFLYNSDYRSILFLGIRYARSTFDDNLIYQTQDAFGNFLLVGSNQKARASWLEITAGTKVRLWKGLFMGYTIRYKFLKQVKSGSLIPHDLPGFGVNRDGDNDQFGFSYYLYWHFPLRKTARIMMQK